MTSCIAALVPAALMIGASAVARGAERMPVDSHWGNPANWMRGEIPGIPGDGESDDRVDFGFSDILLIEPDAGRTVGRVYFNHDVAYTLGATTGSHALSLTHLYTTGTSGTITLNAPLKFRGDGRIGPNPGQTLAIHGTVTLDPGRTLLFDRDGTVNFNGVFVGANPTGNAPGVRFLGGSSRKTAHFNDASPQLNLTLDTGGEGSAHLNAPGAIPGTIFLGTGQILVNAENALNATEERTLRVAGGFAAGKRAVMEIRHSQNYAGQTILGIDRNLTDVQGEAVLLANNPSGSATGASDVRVVSGILGGNGFIVNTGERGVTLEKRVGPNGAVTHGQLSPGAAAGAIGTLTFDLGSKGLDLSAAVAGTATAALQFDLHTPEDHDRIVLLGRTVLHIGDGALAFDDFLFNLPHGTLAAGVYTLFESAMPIGGTLGPNRTGTIAGRTATLELGKGGKSIRLTVAP